ncbi:chemotaxis protein CheY-P-specific phosphatase CheC [Oceanisphaera litoralis]|uniref:response regulator n=1 Tax=Oceanisphaera litoralis TaxID=225144 RepID=UPI001958A00C|nr:response regulator [Oceanisphaera litoralis]MBM7454552.1 chemotaxis protein CheY-P-specific phosphatase CheC [Oceanisphaera litoralis]
MTIRILICDDSALARKQMARTLPFDWDVEIAFASQGKEALELLHNQGADLLFLDLNMPVLDGYGVLEVIRKQELQVITVVVSGDIQPQAMLRVRALGAIGFIKKTIDADELARLLTQYGLYQPNTGARQIPSEALPSLTLSLQDYLQELANVAMGQASNLLARLLNVFILQPVPRVAMIARSELRMTISAVEGNSQYSAVCQGFVGAGVSGEALLLFSDSSIEAMARLLHYDQHDNPAPDMEILMDMSSILFGAFLKGLGDQLDIHFGLDQPTILGQHQQLEVLLEHHRQQAEQLLCIEIPYELEQQHISCNLLVLLTEDSVNRLEQRLIYLTE